MLLSLEGCSITRSIDGKQKVCLRGLSGGFAIEAVRRNRLQTLVSSQQVSQSLRQTLFKQPVNQVLRVKQLLNSTCLRIDDVFGLHMAFIRPFFMFFSTKTNLCISIFCAEQISSLDSLIVAKCYQTSSFISDCRVKLFMLHSVQRILDFQISIDIPKFDRINLK